MKPPDFTTENELPRSARIAIIGAGVSGLTAAYHLQKQGYRNITIYEAEDRVGGKVKSLEIEGHVVELGAVAYTNDKMALHRIGREIGIQKARPYGGGNHVAIKDEHGGIEQVRILQHRENASWLAMIEGFIRFTRFLRIPGFRSITRPGFSVLAPEYVKLTASELAQKQRFDTILAPFRAVLHALGYGSLQDIPALYHVKMMASIDHVRRRKRLMMSPRLGISMLFQGGQPYLEEVAAYLESRGVQIRVGTVVNQAARKIPGDGPIQIEVTAEEEVQAFDRLVVTTDPKQILKYLDATEEEKALFGLSTSLGYQTVVFRAYGLKENDWCIIDYNHPTHRNGHLLTYYNAHGNSRLFTGFIYHDGSHSEADLDDFLIEDIAELGGEVDEILIRKTWDYFPHVKLEDLDENYYPRLNALQSQNGTYYLGGFFAFETTEHCAEFSEYIVKNCIIPQRSFPPG